MRRWRLPTGGTLTESPTLGKTKFYRLDRAGKVDRVYADEDAIIDGELHKIRFSVGNRALMRRHVVQHAGPNNDDRSALEFEKLELLMPGEQPTEAQVREAIAIHEQGEGAVEAARQDHIERLASTAPESLRDVVRRLAEMVVRDDDKLARQMMASLGALAKLHRAHPSAELRAATQAFELAARLFTADPSVRDAALPGLQPAAAAELAASLEAMRSALVVRAAERDNYAVAEPEAPTAAAYRNAAAMLAVSACHLYRCTEIVRRSS